MFAVAPSGIGSRCTLLCARDRRQKGISPSLAFTPNSTICINETGKRALREKCKRKGIVQIKLHLQGNRRYLPEVYLQTANFSCLKSQLSHFIINKPFILHFPCGWNMMEILLRLKYTCTEYQITFIKYSFNGDFFENLQLNRGFSRIC
jgi:hypothetical protein